MTAPVVRQFPGTIPDKGQSQTTFDTNVDAFLDWQALQFAPDLVAFGTFASDTAAALVAANLPSLAGRALDAVRVNAAADGVEFANVTAAGWALLDDANAAAQRVTLGLVIGTDIPSFASPTFTGAVTAGSFVGDGSALTGIVNGFFIVQETQASGTDGGTFTSGAWRTRTLNVTQINTIGSASLASNQVTLPAGTYRVTGSCSGFAVNAHMAAIYNVTNSAFLVYGSQEFVGSADGITTRSDINAVFTISGTKVLEVRHQCQTTRATDGFGRSASFSVPNIYAQMSFEKIA
jgi:hypothetical protein